MANSDELKKQANFHYYLNRQGVRGPQGAKGEEGFSPTITVAQNTANTYILKITDVNGEFLTENLRGSIIDTSQGTYIRYNPETDTLYSSELPEATNESTGGVQLATLDDFVTLSSKKVVTPEVMFDFLTTNLKAGANIKIDYKEEGAEITVSVIGLQETITDIDTRVTALENKTPEIATTSKVGIVKPDGTSITITGDGTISTKGGGGGVTNYADLEGLPVFNAPLTDTVDTQSNSVGLEINDNYINVLSYASVDWFASNAGKTQYLSFSNSSNKFSSNKAGVKPHNYILLPYKFNQVVKADISAVVMFGYLDENGFFTPIAHSSSNEGISCNPGFVTSNTGNVSGGKTTWKTSYGTRISLNDYAGRVVSSRRYQYAQMTYDGSVSTIRSYCLYNIDKESGFHGVCSSTNSSTDLNKVAKITHVLISGLETNVDTFKTSSFGIFSAEGNLGSTLSPLTFEGKTSEIDLSASTQTRNVRVSKATASSLGIVRPDNSTIKVTSDGVIRTDTTNITTEIDSLDARVTALEGAPASVIINDTTSSSTTTYSSNKINELISGGTGTSNYAELTNKPEINSIELIGDKTSRDLNLSDFFNAGTGLEFNNRITSYLTGVSGSGNTFVFEYSDTYSSVHVEQMNVFKPRSCLALPIKPGQVMTLTANAATNVPFSVFLCKKTEDGYDPRFVYAASSTTSPTVMRISNITYSGTAPNIVATMTFNSVSRTSNTAELQYPITSLYISTGYALITCGKAGPSASAYNYIHTIDASEVAQIDTLLIVSTSTSSSPAMAYETSAGWITGIKTGDSSDTLTSTITMQKIKEPSLIDWTQNTTEKYLDSSINGLPNSITTSETDSTVTLASTKAVELNTPTLYVPNNLVYKNETEQNLFLHQGSVEAGDNVTISKTATGIKIASTSSGGTSSNYGIQGDYSTHYGILDCPNGLIDYNATGTEITLNPGIVMQLAGSTTKTTNASTITHTLVSTGAITLFYTAGNLLEAGKVDYQEDEPANNGVDNYQAWFKPSEQMWYFKSVGDGNVWRSAIATPIANVNITDGNITRLDYIGYRILDDDILVQMSEIETLQETIATMQNTINALNSRIEALETQINAGEI